MPGSGPALSFSEEYLRIQLLEPEQTDRQDGTNRTSRRFRASGRREATCDAPSSSRGVRADADVPHTSSTAGRPIHAESGPCRRAPTSAGTSSPRRGILTGETLRLGLRGGRAPSKPSGRQERGGAPSALALAGDGLTRPYHLSRRGSGNLAAPLGAWSKRDMEARRGRRVSREHSPRNRTRPPKVRVWRYSPDLASDVG